MPFNLFVPNLGQKEDKLYLEVSFLKCQKKCLTLGHAKVHVLWHDPLLYKKDVMAARSRFPYVTEQVKDVFNKSQQKVFTLEDLGIIFQECISQWSLSVSNLEDFATQLVQSNILQANKFVFQERIASQIRFWVVKADLYDVAVSLLPNTHLSHITAFYLHGIIRKQPKSIYISVEQTPKQFKTNTSELEQDNINHAFSREQRYTNAKCVYMGKEISVLNSMYTGQLGVIELRQKTVTSIERTLIDITVRPAYAGGVREVLNAFIAVKNTVDIDTLVGFLDDINYTYPYHQSIGFYLEKAGYDESQILLLKEREKIFDFYLDYAMENPLYSTEWRLFYPKNLQRNFVK